MQDDHFVSEFLLKPFTVNGYLHVFNKKIRTQLKPKTPGQICYLRGFTTFAKDSVPPGWDENFLEKELLKWENVIAPIHRKLIQHRTIEAIAVEDFWELVKFTVWLHLCNPAIRHMLQKGMDEFQLRQVQSYSEKDLDNLSLKCFGILLPHAALKKMLNKAAGEVGLLQSEFLSLALGSAEKCFNMVKEQYAWRLDDYKDNQQLLCTSDRPVLLGGEKLDSYVGFGTPGVLLHFPLSPDLCLMGKNVGKGHQTVQPYCKVSDPLLAKANLELMAAKSFNLIIASNRMLLPPNGTELPSYVPEIVNIGNMFGMAMR
jgi:hypothetical protein